MPYNIVRYIGAFVEVAVYKVGSLLVDRYRLEAILGEGGMGRVWRAEDTVLHRQVAIKEVVAPNAEGAEMFLARAEREARNLAAVHQVQGIIKVFDVLKADGRPWIVMEFFELPTLQKYVEEHGVFTAAELLPMALQLITALREVHKRNIMHRDIKPANLLVKPDRTCVLIDFGIARHGDDTLTIGAAIGTLAYMAPEYLHNHRATEAVDAWAVGLLLYFALTGEIPYRRESQPATMLAILNEPAPKLNGTGKLYDVVNGLLQKSPARRMKLDVAQTLLSEELAVAPPLPAPKKPRAWPQWLQRRWLLVGAAAVVAVVAGIVIVPHLGHHAPHITPSASASATASPSPSSTVQTPASTPSASPGNSLKVVAPSGWKSNDLGDVVDLTDADETIYIARVTRDVPFTTLAQEMHKAASGEPLSDITYVNSGFALWKHTYGARCPGSPFPCRYQEQWVGAMRVSGGIIEVRYEKYDAKVLQSTVADRLQTVAAGVSITS